MKTIGEVIKALEQAEPNQHVTFAFGRCIPTSVYSWRGIYAEAALGFKLSDYKPKLAGELIEQLKVAASGIEYTGCKGGEFSYNMNTPLHIDNNGESTNTEITRIEHTGWSVVIHTATEE